MKVETCLVEVGDFLGNSGDALGVMCLRRLAMADGCVLGMRIL